MPMNISIIGGGLIGQQWAMLFSSYHFNVIIYEVVAEQIKLCHETIENNLRQFIEKNISRSDESIEMQLKRIRITNNYNDLSKTSEFVMECVSENLEIKQNVFREIDKYFSGDTIRMSSSSFLPVSKFTANLIHKSKCIIAHPVNPPYFLRLVEIVPALYTDESTIQKTVQLMESIKQKPIVLKKEINGFAINRVQAAVYNSVFKLLKDDVIAVDDIDKLLTEGLGPRWAFYGPIVVAALNGPGVENYFNKYLPGLDLLNKEQNYEPQHDRYVIDRIINENQVGDLLGINETRNFNIGSVLKMKFSEN